MVIVVAQSGLARKEAGVSGYKSISGNLYIVIAILIVFRCSIK
jgi:hypothetical protein